MWVCVCHHKPTPATCSVCGAKGSSLGHSYKNGTCSRCGAKDPNYVKTTYSSGEYWIVDGQWKFTINSVTKHSLCNSFSNSRNGYTNEQVVTINYTYEHIGYSGSNQLGLIFNSSHLDTEEMYMHALIQMALNTVRPMVQKGRHKKHMF